MLPRLGLSDTFKIHCCKDRIKVIIVIISIRVLEMCLGEIYRFLVLLHYFGVCLVFLMMLCEAKRIICDYPKRFVSQP